MHYELTHDTIARQVFDKASTEARTRRKVERHVREQYEAYQERGARLTQDDVDYVKPYLAVINISEAETAFIAQGAQVLKRARQRRRLLIAAIIAMLMVLTAAAFWQSQKAEQQRKEAESQRAAAVEARHDADLKADSLAAKETRLQASLLEARNARDTAEVRRIEAELAQVQADRSAAEARRQKSEAERRAIEARAIAIAARGRALMQEDPTVALNFAFKSYELMPTNSAVALISDLMASPQRDFYRKKWGPPDLSAPLISVLLPEQGQILYIPNDNRDHLILKNLNGSDPIWEITLPPSDQAPKDIDWSYLNNELILLPNHEGIITTNHNDEIYEINWNGQLIRTHKNLGSPVKCLAVSQDGQVIAAGLSDGTIRVLFRTGGVLFQTDLKNVPLPVSAQQQVPPTEQMVTAIAFAPEGPEVSFCRGGLLYVCNMEFYPDQPVKTIPIKYTGKLTTVSYSPDGRYLLAGDEYSQYTHVFTTDDFKELPGLNGVRPCFNEDGTHFTTIGNKKVFIYRLYNNIKNENPYWQEGEPFIAQAIRTIEQETNVNQIAFNEERKSLFCFRGNGIEGAYSYDEKTCVVEWSLPLLPYRKDVHLNDEGHHSQLVVEFNGTPCRIPNNTSRFNCWEEIGDDEAPNKSFYITKNGKIHYSSKTLEQSWQVPDGLNIAAAVFNPASFDFTLVTLQPEGTHTLLRFYRVPATLDGGKLIRQERWSSQVVSVALAPDKQQLLAKTKNASTAGYQLMTWSGKPLGVVFPGEAPSFSKDGQWVITQNGTVATQWSLAGNPFQRFVLTEQDGHYAIDYYEFFGDLMLDESPYMRSAILNGRYGYVYTEYRLRADYLWDNGYVYKLSDKEFHGYAPELFE